MQFMFKIILSILFFWVLFLVARKLFDEIDFKCQNAKTTCFTGEICRFGHNGYEHCFDCTVYLEGKENKR